MERAVVLFVSCALVVQVLAANAGVAQSSGELDCELEENQNEAECLALPLETDETVTNFVPIIGAVVGGAVIAGALAGASGDGDSSVSTNNTN